ncbi:hypothetical protein BD626DRAFT_494073 [Schizophyllum amplum]|uniref:Uncharacterized protein n=1 Tax=Schizophyllum amplum TaxID=97359 RepID=A0A550CHD5_9AGAR|nr:hypothetical protein BD626DRAFT_494073 [Auriculariopsis ampla]
MTDLTYCYLHMTKNDILVLDTLETPDYLGEDLINKGDSGDEDELDIPEALIPPNPEDQDQLPDQIHPSYPYGNPLSIKHPSSRPQEAGDITKRGVYEALGYPGYHTDLQDSNVWRELALDELFPVDEHHEMAARQTQARKIASGATAQGATTNPQPTAPAPPPLPGVNNATATTDEEDEEDEDEEEEEGEGEEEGEDDEAPDESA